MAHTPQHPPTASSAARARPRPGRAQRHLRCSAPGRGAPPPPRRRSPSPQRVASLERPASAPSQPPSGQPAAAARHTRHPARDALLLATGTDLLGTGGVAHSQRALAEVLAARIRDGRTLCCPHSVAPTLAEQEAKALRLFEAVRVRARGSRVAPERFFDPDPPESGPRGTCHDELLLPRLLAAARAALGRWEARGGEGAAAITHLVVGGLTAPRATPGPDVPLARALGLRATVQRTPLHHLGCLGGFRSLAIAADIARADPAARVLVVYGDISSLIGASLQSPMNEADLLSIAIFTDGAAAAVIGGAGALQASGAADAAPLARCVASRSALVRNADGSATGDQMWLRESRYRSDGSIEGENFVGKAVPKHLLRALPPFAAALLQQHATATGDPPPSLADMPVLCHPGGPAVLDTVTRALSLQPWQLEASWAVLGERGNMSGATNLFVLDHFLQQPPLPHASRLAMGLAFGPGLAVEGLLLERL